MLKRAPIFLNSTDEKVVQYLLDKLKNTPINGRSVTIDTSQLVDDLCKDTPVPHIVATADAYLKMFYLISANNTELAWHGTVEKHPHPTDPARTTYLITDIMCYPQTVTGVTVNTDQDEYNKWITDLNNDTANAMKLQGHSHVNMGVTPSGTDDAYYKEMLLQIRSYYIFMIMNKRGEVYIRFYDRINNTMFELNEFDDIVTTSGESIKAFVKESGEFFKPAVIAATIVNSNIPARNTIYTPPTTKEVIYSSPGYTKDDVKRMDTLVEKALTAAKAGEKTKTDDCVYVDMQDFKNGHAGKRSALTQATTAEQAIKSAVTKIGYRLDMSNIAELDLHKLLEVADVAWLAAPPVKRGRMYYEVYENYAAIPKKALENTVYKIILEEF